MWKIQSAIDGFLPVGALLSGALIVPQGGRIVLLPFAAVALAFACTAAGPQGRVMGPRRSYARFPAYPYTSRSDSRPSRRCLPAKSGLIWHADSRRV